LGDGGPVEAGVRSRGPHSSSAAHSGNRGCDGDGGGKIIFIPGAVETDPSEARKRFFLKKEAKTFAYWCARCGGLIPTGFKADLYEGQGLCPWTPLEAGPPDLHFIV
jgi:hypothetical protein